MTTRVLALVIALAGAMASSPARADNRTQAAERFAAAQAAERKSDWRTAISEYEKAYRLEPHPVVLFNIGNNFEKLGENRNAARYFLLYLEDSPNADDQDEVLARVKNLREAESVVRFTSRQRGATVFIDSKDMGTAPLELELAAGRYKVWAEHNGTRTSIRQLHLEYGDPREVQFDVNARPGLLIVDSNVRGAEVRLDGRVVGYTPFRDAVESGEHELVVGMRGYESHERKINVSPQGSEQIRANLTPMAGTKGEGQPESPTEGGNILLGSGYGFNTGAEGFRWQLLLGYRTPGRRIDANALLGSFGSDLNGGLGGEVRLFITTGTLRPYIRGSVLVGREDETGNGGGIGFEGGVGLLIAAKRNERVKVGYEYYLEANALIVPGEDDPMVEDDGNKLSFPIIGGIAIRWGGS